MPNFDVLLEVPFCLHMKGVEAANAVEAAQEAEETFRASPQQFNQPGIEFTGDLATSANVRGQGAEGHYLWLDRKADGSWSPTT